MTHQADATAMHELELNSIVFPKSYNQHSFGVVSFRVFLFLFYYFFFFLGGGGKRKFKRVKEHNTLV